eukprot:GSChrysophyteH1.ASY1.ANO1.1949.1 assembled CDS
MALKYEPGSYVWIEDQEERYLPAKVLKGFAVGEAGTVETEDGEEHNLSEAESKLTIPCNPEALDSKIEDLIEISDLNEMSILHVLRIRFKQDRIYTNISAILISVNPFKLLPLYTPEMLDRYRNGPRGLPPHSTDQSVVISGESGAGKSEATKLILQFITDVSVSRHAGSKQQILAANPILEAFGNAKTLRNNNSSRFGKLITINFDKAGSIVGGGIINYLLEKSRVVGQSIGERNYHIFYQLLSTVKKAALSFRIMGFNETDVDSICKIVAGVLHFGNVKFKAIDVGGDEVLTSRQLKSTGDAVYSELFQKMNFIGVLDIFGFESFEVNTFEQLCINFCNEKLQYHFNEHIFKMEIDLYALEGITIAASSFVDNQPTLDMLELPRTGLFSMLDEECVVPRGSDEGYLSKAKDCKEHLKNFGVLHYAGPNKDSVHDDIVDSLRTSSLSMLVEMFPKEAAAAAPSRGQFKNQLNELVNTLNSTFPHFVRCMKSNDEKKGNIFTSARMQDQLRYAGLVEVCRIRKLGYPVRLLFDEFFRRFKCCSLTCSNLDEQLAFLEKENQSLKLELYREENITAVAILVQKCARRYIARLAWLPHNGSSLSVVVDCKKLLARVLDRLLGALQVAETMDPPLTEADTPLIAECNEWILKIEKINAARAALVAAIASRDIPSLVSALAQAVESEMKGPEIAQATTLKRRLEDEEAAIVQVVKAIDLNDLEAITEAINSAADLAKAAELERRRLEEEEAARKRQATHDAAMEKVRAATKSMDPADLQMAVDNAANMGLQNSEITAAQAVLNNLQLVSTAKSKMDAALKLLKTKANSGLVAKDLTRLKEAIKNAQSILETAPDVPLPELDEADNMLKTYKEQSSINEKLLAAVEQRDRVAIRKALDPAENLGLPWDSVDVATELLRELETKEEPYDEAEEARVQRQNVASQPKYSFQYFSQLRTPDDFARGTYTLWGKNTVRLSHLVHQKDKLPRSITMLSKDMSKRAMEIFQNLLGYMGDKQMNFPPMLAQDVLRKGFEIKPLRDEIYCQIIKQLTNNPRPESVAKGWQLLCMCVATFPPSYDFEMYLMHFILERRDTGRGVVVSFAQYCLRTLEAMLSHGEGVGYVPQVEEIKAFAERPPVLATISLVNGAVLATDLPVTPDTNVLKILEMCVQWTELSDQRVENLGIFVYDIGPKGDQKALKAAPYDDLERTPRPLRNEDFLGDVYITKARQKREFKLVFKKKVFLPSENYRGEDPAYDRLLYLQAEDETIIQGNIELPDEGTAAYLACISMAVFFRLDLGDTVEDLMAQEVQDFIALGWRDQKTPEEWGTLVLDHRSKGMLPTEEDAEDPDHESWFLNLQWLFVETIMESPMYGMHWFYCHPNISPRKQVPKLIRDLPRNMALAFNYDGLHLFSESHECLASYGYADIFRWGGSSGLFELCVITSQSTDQASIILDHIHAIMNSASEPAESA